MVILVVTKSRSVIEDKYSICSPPLLHHQEKWEKSAVLPKSSFALPWKANVRLENFVYQLNHWAHWLNRFRRLTKICAPTRIIRDHPVPFKSKCHDDKTFTAMIGEPHIMGASLFQFVIIFLIQYFSSWWNILRSLGHIIIHCPVVAVSGFSSQSTNRNSGSYPNADQNPSGRVYSGEPLIQTETIWRGNRPPKG